MKEVKTVYVYVLDIDEIASKWNYYAGSNQDNNIKLHEFILDFCCSSYDMDDQNIYTMIQFSTSDENKQKLLMCSLHKRLYERWYYLDASIYNSLLSDDRIKKWEKNNIEVKQIPIKTVEKAEEVIRNLKKAYYKKLILDCLITLIMLPIIIPAALLCALVKFTFEIIKGLALVCSTLTMFAATTLLLATPGAIIGGGIALAIGAIHAPATMGFSLPFFGLLGAGIGGVCSFVGIALAIIHGDKIWNLFSKSKHDGKAATAPASRPDVAPNTKNTFAKLKGNNKEPATLTSPSNVVAASADAPATPAVNSASFGSSLIANSIHRRPSLSALSLGKNPPVTEHRTLCRSRSNSI